MATAKRPYFGLTGGWLTFWVTVRWVLPDSFFVNLTGIAGCVFDRHDVIRV